MEDYKKKLSKIIEDSNLSDEKKLLWELFIKFASSEEDEAVYEAIVEAEENLDYLSDYLRDKIWDMKENNIDTWHKLIKEESRYAHLLT